MPLRLQPFNESPYDLFFYFNTYLNRIVHQHLTCAEFVCLPEGKLEYFRGSFVRNPYDRIHTHNRSHKGPRTFNVRCSFSCPWNTG